MGDWNHPVIYFSNLADGEVPEEFTEMSLWRTLPTLSLFALMLSPAYADSEKDGKDGPQIPWSKGPLTAKIGQQAEIKVPEGFIFTGAYGTKLFLERTQNIPGNEEGMMAPENLD